MISNGNCRIWEKQANHIYGRKNNGSSGNGHTPIEFGAAIFFLLPSAFQYIEKCQTRYRTNAVKGYQCQTDDTADTQQIANHSGEYTKADYIAQRVQLDAEVLFVLGAVFLRPRHHAVEHIADAGHDEADHCVIGLTLQGEGNAGEGGGHTQVGQPHPVDIKANDW